MRRGALVGMMLGILAAGGPPASAQTGPERSWVPAGLDEERSSEHFLVHFTTAADSPHAVADAGALDGMLGAAERAYVRYTGPLGFQPRDDGDRKIDVYIFAVTHSAGEVNGFVRADQRSALASSSAIAMRPSAIVSHSTIIHELFHVMQTALYARESNWIRESTAEWATYNVLGAAGRLTLYRTPEVSLDCQAETFAGGCAGDGYGAARWPLWQALAEQYGRSVVRTFYGHAARLGATDGAAHSFEALDATLRDHGVDITGAYLELVRRMATGSFTLPGLKGLLPRTAAALFTGATSATTSADPLTADHLAARYLLVSSGNAAGSYTACKHATLTLTVALPAVPTRPYFVHRDSAMPLDVSGSTATVSLPWSTCTGLSGTLALANGGPDATADGAVFGVQATLAASAGSASPPAPAGGGAYEVRGGPPPELLSVRIPQKLRRSRTGRTSVKITVQSSHPGLIVIAFAAKISYLIGKGQDLVRPERHQPYLEADLVPGTNTFSLKLPRRHKRKKDFVVIRAYSGSVEEGVLETGDVSAHVVRYLKFKPPQRRG